MKLFEFQDFKISSVSFAISLCLGTMAFRKYSKRTGSLPFCFCKDKKNAARLSFLVPTHSKGFTFCTPTSSFNKEINAAFWNRFLLNTSTSCLSCTKGYKAVNTNKHLGHFPHHPPLFCPLL